ncbi:MAG TPA: thiol peroxidase [Gammaproteobacteria bacterium]|nr:thiol peroxidase [Gammaproteobacteria bacterium]
MATVLLEGNEIHTSGELPVVGSQAPDFSLTGGDLTDTHLSDFQGTRVLLNIVHSLDTSTCAISTRKFNDYIAGEDVAVLVISADLPFAQARFCDTEELTNIIHLSMMRSRKFAKDYGVLIEDGPMKGIPARAIVVIDEDGKVVYTEQVQEVTGEPDYEAALAALREE